MSEAFRVEPRKIEYTTYGPARAPVWTVTFALHTSSGYEHQCTIIVPGLGHDDVAEICVKARMELFRISLLIPSPPEPTLSEPVETPPSDGARRATRRSRQ